MERDWGITLVAWPWRSVLAGVWMKKKAREKGEFKYSNCLSNEILFIACPVFDGEKYQNYIVYFKKSFKNGVSCDDVVL